MSSIRKALIDGIKQLTSRPIYILGMIVVPMFVAFFFLDLMDEGLPLKAPTAIVDLDNSSASRNVTRNLSASELVSLDYRPVSYDEAMKLLKSGDIFQLDS